MKLLIVTDAWLPQVNGVVTTLSRVIEALRCAGHEVMPVTPAEFPTVPCPSYPSIRLSLLPGRRLARRMDGFEPDAIHIATEGPLGHAARRYCLKRGMPFTTAYHTQFPSYLRLRLPVPLAWSYRYLRRFHGMAVRTLVPTASVRDELASRGFDHLVVWSRGVDSRLFRPGEKGFIQDRRPVAMYFGRVAVEKNLDAFLSLDLPGSKYVVGDGPDLATLRDKYPDARFVGFKHGDELAAYVAAADVTVFPSLTDTFGLTLLESMAAGVPVAAFPVTGPRDVIRDGVTGALCDDLGEAVTRALELDPGACREYAMGFSWERCAEQLASNLAPIHGTTPKTRLIDESPGPAP